MYEGSETARMKKELFSDVLVEGGSKANFVDKYSGRILKGAGVLTLLAAASCGGGGGSNPPPPPPPGRVAITSYSASPNPAQTGQQVTLAGVYTPGTAGATYKCDFDFDGNGSTDFTLQNCPANFSATNTYQSASPAGGYQAKVIVTNIADAADTGNRTTAVTVNTVVPKYTLSGKVLKLIANDGTPVTAGFAELVDAAGSRVSSSSIAVDGSFSLANIPAGTYRLKIDDSHAGVDFVPREDGTIVVAGDLSNFNRYVIERGANRFGVPFDATIIEKWYELFGQQEGVTTNPGTLKWDLQGAPPTAIVFDDNPALPQTCLQQLEAVYDLYKDNAISIYTDGRITSLPRRRGQPSNGVIFVSLVPNLGATAISDWPATSGINQKTILQARTRYDQTIACQALAANSDISSAIYEEMSHNTGVPDYQNPNVDGVTNEFPGKTTQRPTNAEKLGFAIRSHPDTNPGNRAPFKNP